MESNKWTFPLLDCVSVGICIIDKGYKVRFWNEYMEEYTGIAKNEITDQELFHFFPTLNNEIYKERIDNIFSGWPPVIFSSRLHTPFFFTRDIENKQRFQEITITPLQSSSSDDYFAVITVQDVTDLTNKLEEQNNLYKKAQEEIKIRKEIQDKLKKSEQTLKELNSSKDKFFSIIAHDLKGPFNAILGFSSLLMETSQDRDFERTLKYSQLINESSESAFALLVNLLEWSRLQTGKIKFTPEFFDLEEVMEDVIHLTKSISRQKHISVFTEIEPHLKIYADKNMISTCIRNFLSNAIKYSYENGKVTLKAIMNKNELVFSVIDMGIGIKKEDFKKLFRIDVNFSRPGTKEESGTGIGLILCKDFIEQHNGKIWIESIPQEGSTFYFSIPQEINTL